LEANEPAVAVNVTEAAPAATVTDAGTVKAAELSASATAAPPAGAAWEIATVQLVLPFGAKLLLAHCRLETVVGGGVSAIAVL
jgi:hypothetical protein